MCSKLWCRYLQLNTATASQKYSTDRAGSWRALFSVSRCASSSNLFISVWAETTADTDCLYDDHCTKSQCQLPGAFTRAGEVLLSQIWLFTLPHLHTVCRARAFQHSLPRKVSQQTADSRACSRTHKHAEGQCPEGKQSPGCILITGGTKPRQGCCSIVRL